MLDPIVAFTANRQFCLLGITNNLRKPQDPIIYLRLFAPYNYICTRKFAFTLRLD